MESRKSNYFEVKVSYIKAYERGTVKRVTEVYAVDAMSFTEADSRITTEFQSYFDLEIKAITRAAYAEVITDCDINANGRYYKAKVAYATFDEKGKEHRAIVTYLVQAGSLDDAKGNLDVYISNSMVDWEKVSVAETKVLDVFFHKA